MDFIIIYFLLGLSTYLFFIYRSLDTLSLRRLTASSALVSKRFLAFLLISSEASLITTRSRPSWQVVRPANSTILLHFRCLDAHYVFQADFSWLSSLRVRLNISSCPISFFWTRNQILVTHTWLHLFSLQIKFLGYHLTWFNCYFWPQNGFLVSIGFLASILCPTTHSIINMGFSTF